MILWHPDLPHNFPMYIVVSLILEFATITMSFEGENHWDEEFCLLFANKQFAAEYSFSPYHYMYDHEIEVEPIPEWSIKEIA